MLTAMSDTAWQEIERLTGGDRLSRPPRRRGSDGRWQRADAGEWDWFYGLPMKDQTHLRRHHMLANGGQAPDQLAEIMGYDDVEAAMTVFVEAAFMGRPDHDWERDWERASWDTDSVAPEPGVLIGPVEVAELCGVKVDTVYQWVSRGRLPEPWDVVSGTRLWPRHEIEAWATETKRLRLVRDEEF